MSIRKFNVNKTESEIALASTLFPGFMSREDKIALDALVAANFAGGSITEIKIDMSGVDEIKARLTTLESSVADIESNVSNLSSTLTVIKTKLDKYPEMPSDTTGVLYALSNGQWDDIAPAGYNVVVYNPASATSTLELSDDNMIQVPFDIDSLKNNHSYETSDLMQDELTKIETDKESEENVNEDNEL